MVAIIKRKSPCDDCPYKKGIIFTPKHPCDTCKKKEKLVIELPRPKRRLKDCDDKK